MKDLNGGRSNALDAGPSYWTLVNTGGSTNLAHILNVLSPEVRASEERSEELKRRFY